MNITNLFTSSVGKKFIMAVTGLSLFLFVVAHLAGNLQVFLGPEAINRYGHFLQTNVELLWPARIGLLVMVGLHIWSAIKLSAENKAARPQPYAQHEVVAASYASRTMSDERVDHRWRSSFITCCISRCRCQAINLTGTRVSWNWRMRRAA